MRNWPAQRASQTSATAAAVSLPHHARCPAAGEHGRDGPFPRRDAECRRRAARPMRPSRAATCSPPTPGCLTLWGLGGLPQIDAAGVARFLRRMAHPGGGFLACDGDDAADVEYTYYGVGTLALLRLLTGG